MRKPLILITNDDGITAPGIIALVEAMRSIGKVVVVAPDSPQSSMGHAITLGEPLRLEKVDLFKNIEAYQCSGTPVDCVKLAKDKILSRTPDLCVSGINHGSNSSINLIYSGTLSAAMEAAIEGIKAIGFSLNDFSFNADFKSSKHYARKIALNVLKYGLPEGTFLNVNVPAIPKNKVKGVRLCRQAIAKWEEDFDERIDPRGNRYFWLTGKFINNDKGADTDEWALAHSYISVVPVQLDFTDHDAIGFIKDQWKI